MPHDLRDTRILLIEQQPVVAADIEDRLIDAGASGVKIHKSAKEKEIFDLRDYDAIILNASQDRNDSHRIARLAVDAGCNIVILDDDVDKASELFPGINVVEIPFDSQSILDALCKALETRKV
jgi:hypothetical protein